ncbi:MAG: helix-turn-helix domain-containing protein, partial [Gemmatimonadota bacterium]
ELLNLVERFTILHGAREIGIADVRSVVEDGGPGSEQGGPDGAYDDDDPRDLRERLDDYERDLIEGALEAAEGNVAEASRRLQTDRANLYRRMRRLRVSPGDHSG